MADATANAAPPAGARPGPPDPAVGKVVELRQAVQEQAGALNDWAHGQARALATTARQKPLAAAGVSAGAAFAAGLVLGLLLARHTAAPKPTWRDRLPHWKPPW